jgi:hypothetical protein
MPKRKPVVRGSWRSFCSMPALFEARQAQFESLGDARLAIAGHSSAEALVQCFIQRRAV